MGGAGEKGISKGGLEISQGRVYEDEFRPWICFWPPFTCYESVLLI